MKMILEGETNVHVVKLLYYFSNIPLMAFTNQTGSRLYLALPRIAIPGQNMKLITDLIFFWVSQASYWLGF